MKKNMTQAPRVVLSWVSADREYRAVLLESNNMVIQTKVGEGWMLLSALMPASWEQSLVVVAMRLIEGAMKMVDPTAMSFMTDEYQTASGTEIVETVKGSMTVEEWELEHTSALILRWQAKPPTETPLAGLIHRHLGLPPPGLIETTYSPSTMTPTQWKRAHLLAVKNSFGQYPPY